MEAMVRTVQKPVIVKMVEVVIIYQEHAIARQDGEDQYVMSHVHQELTVANANLLANVKMEALVILCLENAIVLRGGRGKYVPTLAHMGLMVWNVKRNAIVTMERFVIT
jgi:hypothetical protein